MSEGSSLHTLTFLSVSLGVGNKTKQNLSTRAHTKVGEINAYYSVVSCLE